MISTLSCAASDSGFTPATVTTSTCGRLRAARKIFSTLSVIGREATGASPEKPEIAKALAESRRWPVVVSYFDTSKKQDTPDYPLSFDLYENGVSRSLVLDYNDLAGVEGAFKAQGGKIAAVIVEPVAGSTGVLIPPRGYLERLREIQRLTTEIGLNLAGVERVLRLEDELERMKHRIDRMEAEMRETISEVHRQYRRDLVLYRPPRPPAERGR